MQVVTSGTLHNRVKRKDEQKRWSEKRKDERLGEMKVEEER